MVILFLLYHFKWQELFQLTLLKKYIKTLQISILQTPQGPVLVLKESALQQKGKDAQKNNIAAAKLVADLVKTSLGPRGLDKMLVDPIGDVTITNDAATILKEIVTSPMGS